MRLQQLFAIACCGVIGAPVAAQYCAPYWNAVRLPPSPRPTASLAAMLSFDDGTGSALYAWRGGIVSRWRGHEWEVLSEGMPSNDVAELRVLDDGSGPRLYAVLRQVAAPPRWNSVIWDGQRWVQGPPGLVTVDTALPGGTLADRPFYSFDNGSGMAIYGEISSVWYSGAPARWRRGQWQQIGKAIPNRRLSLMTSYDDGAGPALYAAGDFREFGGVQARNVARWDGTAWHPLGDGVSGFVRNVSVITSGPAAGLYVQAQNIQKWDGQQWTIIPGPDPPPPGSAPYLILAMEVFDDGTGPGLYLGGDFPTIGGLEVNGIARWDGQSWSTLGGGVVGAVERMAVYEDDPRGASLFVYAAPGGTTDVKLLQWVGCPNCYANCDNSTSEPILTVDDVTCFIDRFAAQHPYADCNQDNAFDVDDFVCFINRFAAGCP